MEYDIRKAHDEDAVPLFKKMVKGPPSEVVWNPDKFNKVFITFKIGSYEITYKIDILNKVKYQFYTGVDNIMFQGDLTDPDCIKELSNKVDYGFSNNLRDYINL